MIGRLRPGVRGVACVALLVPLLASCTSAGPAPTAPSSRTAPSSTPTPSRTAPALSSFARTVVASPLGDPARLDVCAIAAGADLRGLGGARLTRPAVADVAGCVLTSSARGARAALSVVVTTAETPATPPYAAAPVAGGIAGRSVAQYPYDTELGSCPRVLTVAGANLTTAFVRVANRGGPSGLTQQAQCELNNRIAARFAAAPAQGAARPTLTGPLLAVDACRAAASTRLAAAVEASPATGGALAFGAGCRFTVPGGVVDVAAGALGAARPSAAERTTAGHRLYLLPAAAPSCAWASPQGREVVLARFTGTGGTVSVDCPVAADALVAYLDGLGLR